MSLSAVYASPVSISTVDTKFLNLISTNETSPIPASFLNDQSTFEKIRSVIYQGSDHILEKYFKRLISEADSFLSEKPVSVTDKSQIPPSGNKHDFYSLAAYEWPNPNTPDGLPYVSRDGYRNPEIFSISDKAYLDYMVHMVEVLSYAYYFTDEPKYAEKAEELLGVWFLNKDTYMNPNFTYAENMRGKDQSNPGGIMAGRPLSDLTEAIKLLQESPNWNIKLQIGMEKWFSDYLDWLLNSKSGKFEVQKMNNHGTYYLVQVSSIALFLNKTAFAKEILISSLQNISSAPLSDLPKLISVKIAPDGRQLFELERANSLDYSIFNLLGIFKLATKAQQVGLDIWHYTNHGIDLQKALDFILPYTSNKDSWPYEQKDPIKKGRLAELLCQGILKFKNNDLYIENYRSFETGNLDLNINYAICDMLKQYSDPQSSN
jgi:Alginate lyase